MKKRWLVSAVVLIVGLSSIGYAQGSDFCLDAVSGAAAAAALADTLVGGLRDAMQMMTATSELQSGDWEAMKPLLGQFEISTHLTYNAWFLRPDGTYYKVATDLATANLSDRAYFAPVMAGEATTGDLVVSRSTGLKSMILTAPIKRDGQVIGALGVTLYLAEFSELLLGGLALPEGVGLYAASSDGRITVHANPEILMEEEASSGIESAPGGLKTSEVLGWTFVLGWMR